MRKLALPIGAGAVALAIAVSAVAVVSFDGKSTSFHTISGAPLPPGPAPFLSGTITKGKKKNVLKIDAMVTSELIAPGFPWTLNAFIDVNGVFAVDPTTFTPPFGAVQDCASDSTGLFTSGAAGCTLSGTWIFDIDAAETSSPGCCYGLPLTVTLWAGPAFSPFSGVPVSASLAVNQVKKK